MTVVTQGLGISAEVQTVYVEQTVSGAVTSGAVAGELADAQAISGAVAVSAVAGAVAASQAVNGTITQDSIAGEVT